MDRAFPSLHTKLLPLMVPTQVVRLSACRQQWSGAADSAHTACDLLDSLAGLTPPHVCHASQETPFEGQASILKQVCFSDLPSVSSHCTTPIGIGLPLTPVVRVTASLFTPICCLYCTLTHLWYQFPLVRYAGFSAEAL